MFSYEFWEISRNVLFTEHNWVTVSITLAVKLNKNERRTLKFMFSFLTEKQIFLKT